LWNANIGSILGKNIKTGCLPFSYNAKTLPKSAITWAMCIRFLLKCQNRIYAGRPLNVQNRPFSGANKFSNCFGSFYLDNT
ncbi:MAG: hypothetical protein KI786_01875, partial [Mameliella sp.]|nr:hypothetical protein [Phaeodactylibacter sp.]